LPSLVGVQLNQALLCRCINSSF